VVLGPKKLEIRKNVKIVKDLIKAKRNREIEPNPAKPFYCVSTYFAKAQIKVLVFTCEECNSDYTSKRALSAHTKARRCLFVDCVQQNFVTIIPTKDQRLLLG
jgi:hypothetical protein